MGKHVLAVLVAGSLWGLTGVFSRTFSAMGLSAQGVIVLRCGIAAIFFGLLLIKEPKNFKIKWKDAWCFFGAGICSLLFFTFCYFQAINTMNLAAAAILLYTAPGIVMVLSLVIFKEKLTIPKVIALILAFLGCALASGLATGIDFSLVGLLYGLGAGFGYALYSIFARFALNRGYGSGTINFYACFLAALGAGLLWGFDQPLGIGFADWGATGLSLLLGFISCFLPYMLYTYGLTGLESGKASVMASSEVVVATLLGVFVFGEQLTWFHWAGVAMIIGAVMLLNKK